MVKQLEGHVWLIRVGESCSKFIHDVPQGNIIGQIFVSFNRAIFIENLVMERKILASGSN